ncbi:ribosome-associated heat shock protein Hsp15 [Neptunomonas marina]|uniref:Heat shock protein 15 n=2 Tax=Neptunomonas marina TaxID=1815562 RepID=A0A437Q5H0_9GAMM|nr:ribosome-associated heat shock protein Hsp15 [Neptunomonas marina]RVU29752.1 ribosome-associated heat shock protein Hsp15 [Neptunomonas marina]
MSDMAKVRLDKWLWAARFYKTRGIAKQMIEGGKVHYEGQRAKCSKAVELGATLQIRQGWDERIIVVKALSEQRRGAAEAQALYEETADSLARREEHAAQRKAMKGSELSPKQKPDKRSRRQLLEVKELQRG